MLFFVIVTRSVIIFSSELSYQLTVYFLSLTKYNCFKNNKNKNKSVLVDLAPTMADDVYERIIKKFHDALKVGF